MRESTVIVGALSLFLWAPSDVSARNFRVGQIPNGGDFSCDSCHGKMSLLEEDLTPFGDDVNRTMRSNNVDWAAIWNLDSDGDGFSNGLELGDPSGAWRQGQSSPTLPTANPGVPNQGICGNGDVEPDELCDSDDLRGESCRSLGFGTGTLKCHGLCRWDTSECGFCGDGYRNPDYEDCDIDAFPDELSCVEYGFLRGELSCDESCDIDTSTCTDEAPGVCGDGIISRGEFCDGDNFGTVDCVRIAYAGGELKCTEDCRWNAEDCIDAEGRRVGDKEREDEDPGDPAPTTPDSDGGSMTTGGLDMGQAPPSVDAGGCSVATSPTWLSVLWVLGLIGLRKRA